MKVAILLLFAAIALSNGDNSKAEKPEKPISDVPFKVGQKYTYEYKTLMRVLHPLLSRQYQDVNIEAMVDLYFAQDGPNFRVTMKMRKPVLKIVSVNPVNSSVPIETIIQSKMTKALTRPVRFIYREGIVVKIEYIKNEPKWSLDIKKGVVSLLHLDVLSYKPETTNNTVYNKTETTILGTCKSLYTVAPKDRFILFQKGIDGDTCESQQIQTYTNMIPEIVREDVQSRIPALKDASIKSVTAIFFNVTKTDSGFKINSANATGTITFRPLGNREDAVTSITNQTLVLVAEQPFEKGINLPEKLMKGDNLIMKLNDIINKPFRKTKLEIRNLITRIKSFIKRIIVAHQDVMTPFSRDLAEKTVETVHTLRTLSPDEISVVLTKLVDTKSKPAETEWLIRILSLVNNENTMKAVLNELRSKPDVISLESIEEFISALGSTPFVSKDVVVHIQDFCQLPVVKGNRALLLSCLVSSVNLMRAQCRKAPFCKLTVPEILRTKLESIEKLSTFPTEEFKEPEVLQYLVIAQTLESPELADILVRIAKNKKLSTHVRVRATLGLQPSTLKLKEKVLFPLFKLYRTPQESEELRLSAITTVLERPTPSIVMACVQTLKMEPSLAIRRVIFDSIVTLLDRKDLPADLLKTLETARDIIIRRRLAPINHRWIRPSIVTAIKLSDSARLELIHKTNFVKSTVVPRSLRSKLDIMLMGQRINILDVDMRAEGIQEILTKLFGIVPTESNAPKTNDKIEHSATPVQDEDFKLFANIRLFGKQWTTLYKSAKTKAAPLKELFLDNIFSFKELAKLLSEGHQRLTKKTIMPVEGIVRIPTMSGVTLVHNITSLMLSKTRTVVKASTTPSLWSLSALLFRSVNKADVTVSVDSNNRILITGGAYFETPIYDSGLIIHYHEDYPINTKVSVNVDLKTMKYTTDVVAPSIKTLLTHEIEAEHVVFLRSPQKPNKKVYRQPIPLESIVKKYNILQDSSEPIERKSIVQLKVGPKKYLAVSNGRLVVSPTPENFIIIRKGYKGRFAALATPKAGYLKADPKTQQIVLSPTEPSLWRPDLSPDNILRLSTLVPTSGKDAQKQKQRPCVYRLYHYVQELQREGIEAKEIERFYKMFNDNEDESVRIMTLTASGNKVILADDATKLEVVVVKSTTSYIKEKLAERPICYGELSKFPICIHGCVTMGANPLGFFTRLLTPALLSIDMRPPQALKKIVAEITRRKEGVEKVIYELKLTFDGLTPDQQILSTLKISKQTKKVSLIIQSGQESKLMCVNLKYPRDMVSLDVSFEPTCSLKHLTLQTKASRMYPRYSQEIILTTTMKNLPAYWRSKIIFISKRIVEPLPYVAKAILDDSLEVEVFKPISKVNYDGCYYCSNAENNVSIQIMLPMNHLLVLKVDAPFNNYKYKVHLPTNVFTLPKGTPEISLAEKVHFALQPKCYHGHDYFQTFDDVEYHFKLQNEGCEHILIQSCSVALPRFLVAEKRMGELKALRIVLEDNEIKVVPTQDSKIAPKIMVNGETVSLKNNKLVQLLKKSYKLEFIFEKELKYLVILNENLGLRVILNSGRTVTVRISPLLSSKVCGLCGNMDSERSAEMITPERQVVKNGELFGVSWLMPAKDCRENCSMVLTKDVIIKPTPDLVCKPLIKLPVCKPNCEPLHQTKILNDVPVVCNKSQRMNVPFNMETKCRCSCPKSFF